MSKGEHAIMNDALNLAQEWGGNWLQPVQDRLSKAYPDLTQDELNKYNAIAQEAMKFGYDLVYSMVEQQGIFIDDAQWMKKYSSRFPWVNKQNLTHLFSTGKYYAWKDGIGGNA